MKLTDFMLYNAMVTNVSSLVEMIDEQNVSDIEKIENIKNRAGFLIGYGDCPKYLENKIDSLLRQLYGEFFLFENGKTYVNQKQKDQPVFRVYTLVPLIPFVEPKRVISGRLTDGDVASKMKVLLKAIDSKELAEKTYAELTKKWEFVKAEYEQAKKNDAFADGKVPFFKKKQYEQSREILKEYVAEIIGLDTQRESVKDFILAIDEKAYFGRSVREVVAELARYQQNLPKKVSDRRKSGIDLQKQAEVLEEEVVQRNCLPFELVKGSTILEKYKQGKLPQEFVMRLLEASLSEKEFEFLIGDEKLKQVVASIALNQKAKNDKEFIEKLVQEGLMQLFAVKTNAPSSMGNE